MCEIEIKTQQWFVKTIQCVCSLSKTAPSRQQCRRSIFVNPSYTSRVYFSPISMLLSHRKWIGSTSTSRSTCSTMPPMNTRPQANALSRNASSTHRRSFLILLSAVLFIVSTFASHMAEHTVAAADAVVDAGASEPATTTAEPGKSSDCVILDLFYCYYFNGMWYVFITVYGYFKLAKIWWKCRYLHYMI